MRQHIEMLRFILAETLIGWALHVLPPGREKRELSIFIVHSWIGKPGGQYVSTNAPTDLQREFQEKLDAYKRGAQ